ncbi:uncharacterized protein LOC106865585 [Brachypodium distachyon]|nr:uncharacterized protein LOC106865585 [Brachypodium distachyon]|eukprot:XP_014751296.1 uncharacterized protein LOC106865585 [Brachypodium distachyon]
MVSQDELEEVKKVQPDLKACMELEHADVREVDYHDEESIIEVATRMYDLLTLGKWKPFGSDRGKLPMVSPVDQIAFLSVLQYAEFYHRPQEPNAGGRQGKHMGLQWYPRANIPAHLQAMVAGRD